MDFSIFDSLLALREEVLAKAGDIGSLHDKNALEVVTRVAQQRDRTLKLAAKLMPSTEIDEVFRAAAAPLHTLTVEHAAPAAQPKPAAADKKPTAAKPARTAKAVPRASKVPAKKAKAAKAAKKAKKAKATKKVKP